MVAGSGNRSSGSSCVFYAVGVVAEVGSGMAAVRDLSRVSDYLLSDNLLRIRLEIDFRLQSTNKAQRNVGRQL